jgi:flagellar motor switch protein FliN/FliY
MVMPETFVTALTAAQIAPAPPRPSAERSGTQLETLMEVELAVTLRFGGRRMLLRDILDLCAGAVVELDRQIQEPVDLLLDGKLVARGDVVVVDGNYGLRVTQILATPTVL